MKIIKKLQGVYEHLLVEYKKHMLGMQRDTKKHKIIYNVNRTKFKNNALVLYTTEPFLDRREEHFHQNREQVRLIATILGEASYNVDVADWGFEGDLQKKYDLLLNIQPLDRLDYSSCLNDNAIRIAYLTTSNPSWQNKENEKRFRELAERRGARLKPLRQLEMLSQKVEKYDAFFFIGNEYNLKSFCEFNLPPTYFIPNTGYDFSVNFDCKDSHKFLFLGSYGAVHKGLDLLLEVFADKCSDCTLYVCGKFSLENDFNKFYYKELYQTPNIKPVGFVDVFSEEFRSICEECSYMILPSCAEGMAGSVLTAMSYGVIPLVSQECGFSEDECEILSNCSHNTIIEQVQKYSERDIEWIINKSRRQQEIVQTRYSMENFAKVFRKSLQSVLQSKKNA